jgi:hypothetical protein
VDSEPPAVAALDRRSTGDFVKLEGDSLDDLVCGECKNVIAGLRAGDAERRVRAVVLLLEGDRATDRASRKDGPAVLTDADVGLVLETMRRTSSARVSAIEPRRNSSGPWTVSTAVFHGNSR